MGDVHDKAVDIRLISATHSELLDLVQQQRFREDLYYRVSTVPLRVPPLRERTEDIPMLVQHFLSRLSQDCGRGEVAADQSAMDALQRYSWPGNIRELRNVLERAVLIAEHNQLTYAAPSIPEFYSHRAIADARHYRHFETNGMRLYKSCLAG